MALTRGSAGHPGLDQVDPDRLAQQPFKALVLAPWLDRAEPPVVDVAQTGREVLIIERTQTPQKIGNKSRRFLILVL
jgi:hypothetical protein